MRKGAVNMKYITYVGTYTEGGSGGIHALRFDAASGKLEDIGLAAELQNPSYLAVSAFGRYLYSVLETEEFEGRNGGAVGSFAIDRTTGALTPLNVQPTEGKAPCHISTDGEGRFLFAANYNEGTVSVFPLSANGTIAPVSSILRHSGSGPVAGRQEGPHAHFASLTPDGKYLCAVDLGVDSVFAYPYSPAAGVSSACRFTVQTKPGAGPRHIAFGPSGKFAYVLTELSNDVIAYTYSPEAGFKELQTVSALPEGYSGRNWCAAIHISPDGKTLYASNREHDSIAVYAIDEKTGTVRLVQHASTLGKWPRDFAIDPTGKFLLAANQNSDTVVVFSIDPHDGKLTETRETARVPRPVCVRFI
jgi:6-phosphogluconolactonase